MKMKSRCVQLLVNVLALSWCAEAGPLVWRQPEQLTSNATCRVAVDGMPVDVLALPKPPDIYLRGEQCQPYEVAMFDSDDESDVSVVFPHALEAGSVRVLPLSAGIKPRVEGKRVSFRARPPFNLVVEPQGRHRALVVSAKRRETFVPDRNDPKVKWLDPGVHRGEMQLYSGQTLYLAPGAVFEGNLVAVGKNMTVCGRGAFSGIPWGWDKGPSRQCWQFRGEHIALRDVAFLGGWYWQVVIDSAKDVCIDGIRIFGARVVNDDGIDICRSQDVVVRNAFIRTQDDCVALKWWCRNVLVENCVLWTDFATVSRLGWECDPQLGEAMENVVFRDLDILHLSQAKRPASHEWPNPAFLIQASNGLPIRDVRLERIRFDTVEPGDLMLIAYSGTCGDPGRTGVCYPGGGSVDRVLLKDFTVPEGSVKMGVRLDACDEKSPISNIVFENVECCEEAVLRNAQAPTVRKANGDFPVFRAGDRVAWFGDSIASNGHRTPSGYINAVRTAAEATGTPGFDNVIGLGFGGWHVYGWHAYERKSLTDPTLPSRFDKVPTMGEVFTNRLDVIVLALGINDHGFPTFPNDDLKIWQDEYDRFISDLKERCRPRRLVICNTTAHTCDPEAAANRRLERMNVLIRELAERHGAVHVDMHTAIWETIDRVRQMKTGLRDLQDFIHPRAVGNAAMARQFCLDIGETKMAEWLSGELERRYAALDARAGDKPRLVCRLRPDRAGTVAGCPCMNYDILWNLNGADRALVGICVPEGWRTSVIRQTQSNGVFRVCGRPDHLTNRVTVTADLDGRVLKEVIDIPAPWLISPDFAFESAWKGTEWQMNEKPPVDVKDVLGWKVHTQTWDYAGDNDPSAIDLRAVNTGYPNGAAYVRRWLYAPRALKLKLVVGTQFWSACNAVRVWLDGKVVAETVLRSGWVDGKPYSCDDKTYPLVLDPGWHDLTALTANQMFDHYFHIRILDAATGKEPSELRVGCGAAVEADRLETKVWQLAIDDAVANGGGKVCIPPGRHVVGQLCLKSNVELHLEKGAVLEGAVGLEHYRVLALPYSEGTWSAVVSAVGVTNVAVTGEGEIFGNGAAWPQPADYGGNQEGRRPRGLFFANCRGVRLEGFALRDAACWGVVLKCCEGVTARRVRIDSHANANNDGFDVEARNVLIEDCDVDSGDDAYCIKSNDPGFAVENVTVRNCIGRSHCNVFKLGTASHGTMRNIRFERCRAFPPRRDFVDRRPGRNGRLWYSGHSLPDYPNGLGISAMAVECVDGGTVEDVSFAQMETEGQLVPVFVRGGTRKGRSCGTPPSDRRVLRRISFEGVRSRGEGEIASSVTGVDGCRVRDVSFRDVRIVCRGASKAASEKAKSAKVPYLPGGYPEATQSFGKGTILPAFGLYVDRTDGIRFEDVDFVLREGSEDVRPPVFLSDGSR